MNLVEDNFNIFENQSSQLLEFNDKITKALIVLIQLLRDDKPLSIEQNNNSLASRIDQNGFYSSIKLVETKVPSLLL